MSKKLKRKMSLLISVLLFVQPLTGYNYAENLEEDTINLENGIHIGLLENAMTSVSTTVDSSEGDIKKSEIEAIGGLIEILIRNGTEAISPSYLQYAFYKLIPCYEDNTFVPSFDSVLRGVYAKIYSVRFVNLKGQLIEERRIIPGLGVIAPEVPKRKGFVHIGWNENFTNVQSDLTITAQYVIDPLSIYFSF